MDYEGGVKMFFAKSYLFMFMGLIMCSVAFMFGMIFPVLILWLPLFIVGALLIFISLARVHMDVLNSTLYNLIEETKPGYVNWIYVYGDGEMIATPAMRKLEMHSYSPKLDQQVREWKTYRFAGHTVRIVPEGIGHSVDLGKCLYVNYHKRVNGIRSIFDLRKMFRDTKDVEEVATIAEYKEKKVGEP